MPDIIALKRILIDASKLIPQDLESAIQVDQTAKPDGSIVTQIDALLQSEITAMLNKRWPHIPLLGEEMRHHEQSKMLEHASEGLWVLDPLDGTTNFTNNIPMYGLSLAYVKGGETRLAVIFDPNRRECFSAQMGKGTYVNDVRLKPALIDDLSSCVANVDYKRLTESLASRLVSCPPYRSQRNMGSCVLEWCWLAANRIQVYLHGGQQLWDHAAGRLILTEAGGVASRLDGAPMVSNKLVKQSSIAASNPRLYRQWFEWVRRQGQ